MKDNGMDYSNFDNNSKKLKEPNKDCQSVFVGKTADQWMQEASLRKIPSMLFSEFWFEREICILFADSNVGKTPLAVVIGLSIATGEPRPGFKMEANKQMVLFFDFELSDKMFEKRYSNDYHDHYKFGNNFIRIELNPETIPEKDVSNQILNSIEFEVKKYNAKIIIIDNGTYLNHSHEKSQDALPLMKKLKKLGKKLGLSIMILFHVPKRNLANPITRNDLAGSKMLINFCDSSFSIGESAKDNNIRYLKQIKARNSGMIYGPENVITCEIEKPSNFLDFKFVDFSIELEHLQTITIKEINQIKEDAYQLADKKFSARAIALKLGRSHVTISKWLKQRIQQ